MKILAISYLYPNKYYPEYGIFVLNRLKAVNKYCEVKVINPIPWFPFYSYFKQYKNYNKIPEREIIGGIEVFHPKFFIIPRYMKFLDAFTFSLAVVPPALKLRKQYLYDLIDLHWTYPDLLSGHLLAKILKLKQIVTIRGKEALNFFIHKAQTDSKKNKTFYYEEHSLRMEILKYLLRQSDFVIPLSNDLKELSVSLGVDSDKIKVIRNGVDTSAFHFIDKERCCLQLGLSQHEYIILSVGSVIYEKGFDRIINSFPEILKQNPNAVLYIIGSKNKDNYFENTLKYLIKEHNLENKVRCIGQINNRDLALWYNAADLFCLASRSEGSPNVLTEALACGCPSVATNVGSVPEILNHDFMGTVVSNNDESLSDGILSVFSKKYDRQRISEFMKQYDWDWCAKQVLEIYKMLLNNE